MHYVTNELDGGPPILQVSVPIESGDDAVSLAARILDFEHVIFPEAVNWHLQGRLVHEADGAYLDGKKLPRPARSGNGRHEIAVLRYHRSKSKLHACSTVASSMVWHGPRNPISQRHRRIRRRPYRRYEPLTHFIKLQPLA